VKLIIDARHWLLDDGSLPIEPPRLRRQALRMARLIEYGGPLRVGEIRETLVECTRRPRRSPCPGLLWVRKLPDDSILASCIVCEGEEIYIHDWQETEWAEGPMPPAAPPPGPPADETLH
jgi:hypothetical protein